MPKPRLFIGSSSEGREIAHALQAALDRDCEATVWDQGVFGLGQGTLETLVQASESFDYAALVLTPDDLLSSRGEEYQAPRDNVLFELGLFMGRLGRERTYLVHNRLAPIKLPSDLAAVTTAMYEPHSDGNLIAALGVVATKMRMQMKRVGPRQQLSGEVIGRRAISVPPAITVTGGREVGTKACDVALEFGRRVAGMDVRLFSGVARGVDECFCQGVDESLTAAGKDVRRVLTCYTGKGRAPAHRHGKILESRYWSREEGVPELISESDIVVTFGGGKNTHYLGVLTLLEGRILLPVAASGDASSDLHALVASRFDNVFAGRLPRDAFTDLADVTSSPSELAISCMRAIGLLVQTG